jgi:aspartate/methionine/tyrosine aminotransferase
MGLLAVLMAFTNEGDEILVPEIGYPFFQNVCPAMNRVAIPYKLNKSKIFEIDLEETSKLVSPKTAFIYIINPSNPMGTVFSVKHME